VDKKYYQLRLFHLADVEHAAGYLKHEAVRSKQLSEGSPLQLSLPFAANIPAAGAPE